MHEGQYYIASRATESQPGAFCRLANHSARAVGTAGMFVAAIGVVLLWGLMGLAFHFSDTWQLVINTGTTIITLSDVTRSSSKAILE